MRIKICESFSETGTLANKKREQKVFRENITVRIARIFCESHNVHYKSFE